MVSRHQLVWIWRRWVSLGFEMGCATLATVGGVVLPLILNLWVAGPGILRDGHSREKFGTRIKFFIFYNNFFNNKTLIILFSYFLFLI